MVVLNCIDGYLNLCLSDRTSAREVTEITLTVQEVLRAEGLGCRGPGVLFTAIVSAGLAVPDESSSASSTGEQPCSGPSGVQAVPGGVVLAAATAAEKLSSSSVRQPRTGLSGHARFGTKRGASVLDAAD
jgi:hypothetical protein